MQAIKQLDIEKQKRKESLDRIVNKYWPGRKWGEDKRVKKVYK